MTPGERAASMTPREIVAWVVVVICVAAALVSLVVRPMHWERTLAVAIVAGVAAAIVAARWARTRRSA